MPDGHRRALMDVQSNGFVLITTEHGLDTMRNVSDHDHKLVIEFIPWTHHFLKVIASSAHPVFLLIQLVQKIWRKALRASPPERRQRMQCFFFLSATGRLICAHVFAAIPENMLIC